MLAVKRHDMGMLQPCQREVLDVIIRCDLEHDLAIGERWLSRQETAPRAPRPSSASSRKSPRVSPASGNSGGPGTAPRRRSQSSTTSSSVAPLGEPLHQLRQRRFLTFAPTNTDFLIDQSDRRVWLRAEGRMTLEKHLGRLPLSTGPRRRKLFDQAREGTGLPAARELLATGKQRQAAFAGQETVWRSTVTIQVVVPLRMRAPFR